MTEIDPGSFLFITLDSCRYDAFLNASAPVMKGLGELHRAWSPSYFTYGAHAAFFMGFTPGDGSQNMPYVNPKFAKIFKLVNAGNRGHAHPFMELTGRSIVDGLRNRGYFAYGSSGNGWFDPGRPSGKVLTEDFTKFEYLSRFACCEEQVRLGMRECDRGGKLFVFLNINETHVPYWHDGAPWDRTWNPCRPFDHGRNDRNECRRRQEACISYVDSTLAPLIRRFRGASVIICADHGDAWGEDGIWEHGVWHPIIFEVPLIFRLLPPTTGESA